MINYWKLSEDIDRNEDVFPKWLAISRLYSLFDNTSFFACQAPSKFFKSNDAFSDVADPSSTLYNPGFIRILVLSDTDGNLIEQVILWTHFENPENRQFPWHLSNFQPKLQLLFDQEGLTLVLENILMQYGAGHYCSLEMGQFPLSGGQFLTAYSSEEKLVFINSSDIFSESEMRDEMKYRQRNQTISMKKAIREAELFFGYPCSLNLIGENGRLFLFDIQPVVIKANGNKKWLSFAVQNLIISLERAAFLAEFIVKDGGSNLVTNDTKVIAKGNGNFPTIVSGNIILKLEDVVPNKGQILITRNSHPIPYEKLQHISAVISNVGTNTSHAAIIASALGKPYVTGVKEIALRTETGEISIDREILYAGELITVNGATGEIFKGLIEIKRTKTSEYEDLLDAENYKELIPDILVNCDDLIGIRDLGLESVRGFGLIRTEHMVTMSAGNEQLPINLYKRGYAEKKQSFFKQVEDLHFQFFTELNTFFPGKSLCFRFFDFLEDEVGNDAKVDLPRVSNPMLGERGSRLGVLHDGLYESQFRGLLRGMVNASPTPGLSVMLPFVAFAEEIRYFKRLLEAVSIEEEFKDLNIPYEFGIMLEQPALLWQLEDFADIVDFVSVGSNDLTQLSLGISRNDGNEILQKYLESGIINTDPFQDLSVGGTWDFIVAFRDKLRSLNPAAKFGVCGVHAGINLNFPLFCNRAVDYLSVPAGLVKLTQNGILKSCILRKHDAQDELLLPAGCFSTLLPKCFIKVLGYLRSGKKNKAQLAAFAWARQVSTYMGLPENINWKFFKRDICHHWYGKNEFKRFAPGWQIKEVLLYGEGLGTNQIRLSVFPNDIACHSISVKLSLTDFNSWAQHLPQDAQSNWVEAFPNRPANEVCFRSYFSMDEYYYEFSEGQAMMAFEEQQGLHDIIRIDCKNDILSQIETADTVIKPVILEFLNANVADLRLKHFDLITKLGFSQISVEGYVVRKNPIQYLIVDIDSPFDVAFI
ncbi:MAG: putative PEP-binding protein [Bacteroidota bacterium]